MTWLETKKDQVAMEGSAHEKSKIIVTTDVNGTTTPHNTFAELVRSDGLFDQMKILMKAYTSGTATFSAVLPKMKRLTQGVDRLRVESYARNMPLHKGVKETFDALMRARNIDAKLALSTTGFAGLMALVNKHRHGSLFGVAASPVLVHLLNSDEKACLIRAVTDEKDKIRVIDDLATLHRPNKQLIFHIGDTMGDFFAIKHAAQRGGVGIAFNPNKELEINISRLPKSLKPGIREIAFRTDEEPDYCRVLDMIKEVVWERLRLEL
ncbi:MAG: hypothetical protein PVJ62_02385 [Deltaproteobacteria bacterium]